MTSLVLARLERQMRLKREQAPAPAPSDLGEAIERIIEQRVQEQVADQLEKLKPLHNPAVPVHRREFTNKADSHEFPPGPPRTAPPKDMTMLVQRDELGRIKFLTVGNDLRFEMQRDSQGRPLRVIKLD